MSLVAFAADPLSLSGAASAPGSGSGRVPRSRGRLVRVCSGQGSLNRSVSAEPERRAYFREYNVKRRQAYAAKKQKLGGSVGARRNLGPWLGDSLPLNDEDGEDGRGHSSHSAQAILRLGLKGKVGAVDFRDLCNQDSEAFKAFLALPTGERARRQLYYGELIQQGWLKSGEGEGAGGEGDAAVSGESADGAAPPDLRLTLLPGGFCVLPVHGRGYRSLSRLSYSTLHVLPEHVYCSLCNQGERVDKHTSVREAVGAADGAGHGCEHMMFVRCMQQAGRVCSAEGQGQGLGAALNPVLLLADYESGSAVGGRSRRVFVVSASVPHAYNLPAVRHLKEQLPHPPEQSALERALCALYTPAISAPGKSAAELDAEVLRSGAAAAAGAASTGRLGAEPVVVRQQCMPGSAPGLTAEGVYCTGCRPFLGRRGTTQADILANQLRRRLVIPRKSTRKQAEIGAQTGTVDTDEIDSRQAAGDEAFAELALLCRACDHERAVLVFCCAQTPQLFPAQGVERRNRLDKIDQRVSWMTREPPLFVCGGAEADAEAVPLSLQQQQQPQQQPPSELSVSAGLVLRCRRCRVCQCSDPSSFLVHGKLKEAALYTTFGVFRCHVARMRCMQCATASAASAAELGVSSISPSFDDGIRLYDGLEDGVFHYGGRRHALLFTHRYLNLYTIAYASAEVPLSAYNTIQRRLQYEPQEQMLWRVAGWGWAAAAAAAPPSIPLREFISHPTFRRVWFSFVRL